MQRAVTLAAVGFPRQDVTIAIGPGEFGGAAIALPLTESALTIVGTDDTTITPVQAAAGQAGFDVGEGVGIPVTIENLRITADSAAPVGASSRTGDGAVGQDQVGIASRHPGALVVRDVEITGLRGGAGGRGPELGGDGGSALGIVHASPDPTATTSVTGSRIEHLKAGTGGAGEALGGFGGTAAGVLQLGQGRLLVESTDIADVRGGRGAKGVPGRTPDGDDGPAYAVAVSGEDGEPPTADVRNVTATGTRGADAAAVFSGGATVRITGSRFDNPAAPEGTCLVGDDGRILDVGYNVLPRADADCPPSRTTRISASPAGAPGPDRG